MGIVAAVFVVVLVSLVVTRVAAVALALTGLSRGAARFQVRSAFFGVGFTTSESEAVVDHPVRRRIVGIVMLLGNAGIVGAVASLFVSFARTSGGQAAARLAIIVGGLLVLWLLARSRAVDRVLSRVIGAALRRWTDLDVRDYESLLELSGEYGVMELEVDERDWVAGRTLADLALRDEGIVVLGIHRRGAPYIGAPDGETLVLRGDKLVLYARSHRLCELDERVRGVAGDRAHADAVAEQEAIEAAERETAAARGRDRAARLSELPRPAPPSRRATGRSQSTRTA